MKELTLYARQKKLLSILNVQHGVETGKALAARLGVSERTIRNDIREINQQLEPYDIRILPLHGKGYTLSIRDRAVFLELFSDHENYITKDDRIRTLMFRLLRENDWVDLGDLEDEMYVSRTTLESDLKTIKKRFSARHPYLQMQRNGNYIRLDDNEIKRRDLLIRLYAENWDYDSRDGIILRQDEFGRDILEEIRAVVKKGVRAYTLQLDDFSLIYLTLSIAVLYFRTREGNSIGDTGNARPDTDIHNAVFEILDELQEKWNISFSHEEYFWLSDILRQIQILNNHSYNKNEILEYTDVICHQIVNQVLKDVENDYGMDFTSDDKLFVDMTIHVQALISGIVATQIQSHMLGDELRRRYPFLGDIAHSLRLQLVQHCEMELDWDEEDYLLPFLISAQRTRYRRQRGKGIPTAVISHLNGSLTHFLMEQLRKFYGDVLDLRGPFPIHAREKADKENPRLVVTTVRTEDFKNMFSVPIVTVSALLEESDRKKMDNRLTYIKNEILYPALPVPVSQYFTKELLCCMNNRDNPETVISSIQDNLYHKCYALEKRAFHPETDYCSLRNNGLVFLYQTDERIRQSRASLVKLKKSISWKYARDVGYVFFLVLRPQERRYLGWFYYLADILADDPDRLSEIIEKQLVDGIRI